MTTTALQLRVPLVIGHEEEGEGSILERSDLPSAGWITRLWRDGRNLVANIEEVAPIVARLLNAHRYNTISAEIYPDFNDEGMTLRRVAMLGGDLPQVKTLGEIPLPDAGEGWESLEAVVIFSAGIHRDRKYTIQDLDDIVRNFQRFSMGADGKAEAFHERPGRDRRITLIPRGTRLTAAGTVLVFNECCVGCEAAPEKLCGGKGSKKPGPCPKGRGRAHETSRAYATSAAHAAGKTGAALKKAQTDHANAKHGTKGGVQANERLSAAHEAHEAAQGRAERAEKRAKALEHQHGVQQRTKAIARDKRPVAKSSTKKPAKPSQDALDATVKGEHEDLRKATARIGGIVKIPELVDRMKANHPGLSTEEAHSHLQDMQKRDKLTLQLANDPRLEPRAAESIMSPRGKLHYVQMRPEEPPTPKPAATAPKPKAKPAAPSKPAHEHVAASAPGEHVAQVIKAYGRAPISTDAEIAAAQAKVAGMGKSDLHALAKGMDFEYSPSTPLNKMRHELAKRIDDRRGTTKRVGLMDRAEGEGGDIGAAVNAQHVAKAVKTHGGDANLAPLHKVRQHLAMQGITERSEQDAAIKEARKRGLVTGSAHEGRHGVSPEQKAAELPEKGGNAIGHLSIRERATAPAEPAPKATPKPAAAAPKASSGDDPGRRTLRSADAVIPPAPAKSQLDKPPEEVGQEYNRKIKAAVRELQSKERRTRDGSVELDKSADPTAHNRALYEHAHEIISKSTAGDLAGILRGMGKNYIPAGREARVRELLRYAGEEVGNYARMFAHEQGVPFVRHSDLTPHSRVHHTATRKQRRAGGLHRFSETAEGTSMSHEEMIEKLKGAGMSDAELEGCSDVALAAWIRSLDGADEGDEPEDMDDMPGEEGAEDMDDMPEDMDKDKVEDMDEFDTEEEPLDELEKPEMPTKKMAGSCGDKAPMKYSETKIKKLVAEARKERAALRTEMRQARKFREQTSASVRKTMVDAFIESRSQAGKILPYELDPAEPSNLRRRLMRANASEPVAKFSEKGKTVELTELDLEMRSIDLRKPFLFGERFTDPHTAATAADAEESKVLKFAETSSAFRKALSVQGKTPADFVREFKAAKAKNPKLTASEYGVPDAYAS